MLPKKYRLSLKTEFQRVHQNGRFCARSLFTLLFCPQPEELKANSRFAFIAPLKVDKRSVYRHRAKRLFTEAVRAFLHEVKPGFDAVFMIKKEAVGKNYGEVKTEVEKVFKEAGLLFFPYLPIK